MIFLRNDNNNFSVIYSVKKEYDLKKDLFSFSVSADNNKDNFIIDNFIFPDDDSYPPCFKKLKGETITEITFYDDNFVEIIKFSKSKNGKLNTDKQKLIIQATKQEVRKNIRKIEIKYKNSQNIEQMVIVDKYPNEPEFSEPTSLSSTELKPSEEKNEPTKTPEDNTDIQPPTPKQPSIASIQKIFFGPPGTGKSYKAKKLKEILNEKDDELIIIRATFHPEYLNSDFIAKLVPVTNGEKVEYKVLPGHFVKAFAKALANPDKHVLLIIEEINRGNCSAIFGEVFQLLDRDDNGESVYENEWSDLAKIAIKEEMEKVKKGSYDEEKIKKIPANMSIVATMNTCDENIFFMDSAFKRRWGFEYVGIEYESSDDDYKKQLNAKIEDGTGNITWKDFLKKLNSFIKGSKAYRLEDKLVGQWFIKAKYDKISKDDIKNKLMHYLWDNVFSKDRKPLIGLLEDDKPGTVDLKTFGDFIEKYDVFIEKIMKIKIESK
jgi:hypothetical protein